MTLSSRVHDRRQSLTREIPVTVEYDTGQYRMALSSRVHDRRQSLTREIPGTREYDTEQYRMVPKSQAFLHHNLIEQGKFKVPHQS
jgi:hypothetical protein